MCIHILLMINIHILLMISNSVNLSMYLYLIDFLDCSTNLVNCILQSESNQSLGIVSVISSLGDC